MICQFVMNDHNKSRYDTGVLCSYDNLRNRICGFVTNAAARFMFVIMPHHVFVVYVTKVVRTPCLHLSVIFWKCPMNNWKS
jgi:hypothetical protein